MISLATLQGERQKVSEEKWQTEAELHQDNPLTKLKMEIWFK